MIEKELKNKVEGIGKILNDPTKPLKQRFRALFTLRNIGGEESIECIRMGFKDPSALLKHELAYCLGQMGDLKALPVLQEVLEDKSQEAMVRHEAGEAIGAIGCESSIPLLQVYCSDPVQEVAETCHLALKRILWLKNKEGGKVESAYHSVDPAPASLTQDVQHLSSILLDDKEDLFERYKAMFALRNINSPESIQALCKGLSVGSALFRHEVAFVLGQMQSSLSVSALIQALENESENEMVRHECAEALGSIATEECTRALQNYQHDHCRVVSESCDIALDMADYELSCDFQYANSASIVTSEV